MHQDQNRRARERRYRLISAPVAPKPAAPPQAPMQPSPMRGNSTTGIVGTPNLDVRNHLLIEGDERILAFDDERWISLMKLHYHAGPYEQVFQPVKLLIIGGIHISYFCVLSNFELVERNNRAFDNLGMACAAFTFRYRHTMRAFSGMAEQGADTVN